MLRPFLIFLAFVGGLVWAQDDFQESDPFSAQVQQELSDSERDPAAVNVPSRRRNYPGGADEEDLRVQVNLPQAESKVDSRLLQRDVYKQLFNQELKEERDDEVEE